MLADRGQLAVDGEHAVRQDATPGAAAGVPRRARPPAPVIASRAPRGDLRTGRERLPSRYLLETAAPLTGRPRLRQRVRHPHHGDGLDAVPSFAAGIRRSDAAASVVEHDLGVIDAFATSGGDPAIHPLVARTPIATGLEAVRAAGIGCADPLGRQRGRGTGSRPLARNR